MSALTFNKPLPINECNSSPSAYVNINSLLAKRSVSMYEALTHPSTVKGAKAVKNQKPVKIKANIRKKLRHRIDSRRIPQNHKCESFLASS